jgi:DNA polymerase
VLDAVRDVALGCPRCRLAETRRHVVFGEGDPRARIMVVGEAPGRRGPHRATLRGQGWEALDLLLATAGIARESVYICNVSSAARREPQPEADEVEACSPVPPAPGGAGEAERDRRLRTFAAQTLLGTDTSIGRCADALTRTGPRRSTPAYLSFPHTIRPGCSASGRGCPPYGTTSSACAH